MMFEEQGIEKAAAGQLIDRSPTITERLSREKQNLEARLADVTAALNALQSNPEVEKILNLVAKAHRF